MDVRNIGPGGRRRRYLIGGAAVAVGLAAAAGLAALDAPRGLRAFLALPFWLAGLGFFQAQGHT
jgi:hypothetical protein